MTNFSNYRPRKDISLSGAENPTTSTVAVLGELYQNTTTGEVFQCIKTYTPGPEVELWTGAALTLDQQDCAKIGCPPGVSWGLESIRYWDPVSNYILFLGYYRQESGHPTPDGYVGIGACVGCGIIEGSFFPSIYRSINTFAELPESGSKWIGTQGTDVPIPITSPSYPDLLGFYTAEDVIGSTVTDSSTNNSNDGTLRGTMVLSGTDPLLGTQCFASTRQLGFGNDLLLPNTLVRSSPTFSVSMWFRKQAAPTPTQFEGLLCINDGANAYGFKCEFQQAPSEQLFFGMLMSSGSSQANMLVSTAGIPIGDWVHLVMNIGTISGDPVQIYINNSRLGNTTLSFDNGPIADYPLRLGGPNDSTDYSAYTDFDQVRFFNRQLTQAEVTELYNEGTA